MERQGGEEFTVPCDAEAMRADRLLAIHFPQVGRARIQEILAAGLVLRNGQPISVRSRLVPGDRLWLHWPEMERPPRIRPYAGQFEVLHEDEDILVLNKPAGTVVHPGAGTSRTLIEGLLMDPRRPLAAAAGENRPGVVHRLDRDTSGALILAKTNRAYFALVRSFAAREIHKKYDAIVAGRPHLLSGTIQLPIGRSNRDRTRMAIRQDGRPARTDWQVVAPLAHGTSHLALVIHSGRTHQIRVHLSHLGLPILGDLTYGCRRCLCPEVEVPRLLLHATELRFCHPVSGNPLTIVAPFPDDFQGILNKLSLPGSSPDVTGDWPPGQAE